MTARNIKKKAISIILMLCALLITTDYAMVAADEMESLPIYEPADLIPGMVDEGKQEKAEPHLVGDWEFTSHLGKKVSSADLDGKIKIVNFFFTTCPSVCPDMLTKMRKVQDALLKDDDVVMLSHSVDPETDVVPVLRAYAERYGMRKGKWYLLTGDKKEIYRMARKEYFAVFDQGDGGKHDFIHTDAVVLVDPAGRLRGFYHGALPHDVQLLIQDVKMLKKEIAAKKSGNS